MPNQVQALGFGGAPAWSNVTPAAAGPNAWTPVTIYDAAHDRMIVVDSNPTDGTNVWTLPFSAGTWQHVVATGSSPSARQSFSVIYDSSRNRLVLFGGGDYSRGLPLNDTYALALSGSPAWSMLTPSGTPPSVRRGASASYDAPRDLDSYG